MIHKTFKIFALTSIALIGGLQTLRAQNTVAATGGDSRPRVASKKFVPQFDESAREDKTNNGQVERVPFQPGDKNIRVTVDVPSFIMTLWQNDKEVARYNVGVGQKEYPIAIGPRTATQVILNPDWIPPDSDWVSGHKGVKPGERIPASDPRNPIGKIKIPLGSGYLLHQAKGAGDLGSLVSHGCVRVLQKDLVDISRKIADAYDIPGADKAIAAALTNKKQKALDLGEPLEVEILYDTMVVENGKLHIYPDVYERNTNTVEHLRRELESNRVNAALIKDQTLEKMLAKATGKQQFVVALADVVANRALTKGVVTPVVGAAKTSVKPAAKPAARRKAAVKR